MSATTVQSKLVPLRLSTDGGTTFNKVVCLKTWDFTGTTPTQKENTQCGVFTGLGPNGWTVNTELLVNSTPASGEISKNAIEAAWLAQTRCLVRMENPDQGVSLSGTVLHLEGACYITSMKVTAQVGQLMTISVTLEGDGDPTYAA